MLIYLLTKQLKLMNERILSIDIGGSKIKGSVLNDAGELLNDYVKLPTPKPASPANVISTIQQLTKDFSYDKIAIGFPGYVRDGIVHTAPNLGNDLWNKVDLAHMVAQALNKPVKIANDADMLGLGIVSGKGLEMMITLGTGFGTALFLNGKLLPHLEIAHHPIKKDMTYDEYLGNAVYEEEGAKKWNKRLEYALTVLQTVFNYDRIYIGGGNARNITFELPANAVTVTNIEGIDGGARIWR